MTGGAEVFWIGFIRSEARYWPGVEQHFTGWWSDMNVVKWFYLCFEGVVMGSDFHRNCLEKSSCQVINNKNIPKTQTHHNVNHLMKTEQWQWWILKICLWTGKRGALLVMVSSKLWGSFAWKCLQRAKTRSHHGNLWSINVKLVYKQVYATDSTQIWISIAWENLSLLGPGLVISW